MALSTIEGLDAAKHGTLRARRALYGTTTAVLVAVIGLGVVDGLGWLDVYGVDSAHVRADGGGYHLDVQYPTVTRPALASPFEVIVTAEAGSFDGPITIGVNREYMKMWDANAVLPNPSGERSNGDWMEWEFDPPDGDTFVMSLDSRIEPAVQSGRDGRVAVFDDGVAVVMVEFETAVRP